MPTNHRRIPIREKILGLYYNQFQIIGPCTDSQISPRALENSLFSSPVEKVGLGTGIGVRFMRAPMVGKSSSKRSGRAAIPSEEVLAEIRAADPPVSYLVGTPKGRLSKLAKHLVTPWSRSRELTRSAR
jgi:hypothetical protein